MFLSYTYSMIFFSHYNNQCERVQNSNPWCKEKKLKSKFSVDRQNKIQWHYWDFELMGSKPF